MVIVEMFTFAYHFSKLVRSLNFYICVIASVDKKKLKRESSTGKLRNMLELGATNNFLDVRKLSIRLCTLIRLAISD